MTHATTVTVISNTAPRSSVETPPALPDLTIGIDLGDRHSDLCAIERGGEILEESRMQTTPRAFRQRFSSMPPARIAIEVGTHSPWVQALLTELGHEVVVANPRKLQAIYKSNRKCDRRDAEQLARFARLDPKLLSPITHRGMATRADLQLLRSRAALVDARTQLVNHVRGSCKPFGVRLATGSSTATFPRRVARKIPRELRPALIPILRTIAELTERIRKLEHRIERTAAERYPETKRLRQVDGIGAVTALTYVLTLEDPTRFPKSRVVGAFLGICPKRNQSGKSDPEMHISKAGDPELRRLLVQSAQYILGPFGTDCDLRRFGLAMAARGNKAAKRRALVAVARKLAVLLHRLWLSGEEYEPLRQAKARDA
ncbi:MAG TPA: IS110 family transposase [Planctomycetota bacterium]|nr:IS110 family transposase [Planctomycetota bacterium]